MKKVLVRCLLVLPLLTVGSKDSADAQTTSSLRQLADKHNMLIGTAVQAQLLGADPEYRESVAREFSVVTAEYEMKFGQLSPAQGEYDFSQADAIVAFAEKHSMQVHGHTLVWHRDLPAWVEQGDFTHEQLEEFLRSHILRTVRHFRGKVKHWDVVNEAVSDLWGMRGTIWSRALGRDYIEKVFRWANQADPDALLFYNDYGCEDMGWKSDRVYKLVKKLLEKGVPIHGVGLQAHMHAGWRPKVEKIRANVRRLKALGLRVWITELDVPIKGEPSEEKLARQAERYGELMRMSIEEGVEAFITWGFTDKHSWVPHVFKGQGHALIFDENYAPKPAYYALANALR